MNLILVIDACNIHSIETINVLMVEDCAIYATMINEAIHHDGRLICDVPHAVWLDKALSQLSAVDFNVILLDLCLPD